MGKDKGVIWNPGWTGVFTLYTTWENDMEGRGCSGDRWSVESFTESKLLWQWRSPKGDILGNRRELPVLNYHKNGILSLPFLCGS